MRDKCPVRKGIKRFCTSLTIKQTEMKIGQDKVVGLTYELEVDGKIVDSCPEDRPLDYIHGTRTLLEKFEKNIEGLEPGDSFSFTLAPADAYGEVDPDRVIDLPKAAFEVNGEIREDLMTVGNRIPLVNKAGGIVPGIILEVSENSVKIDLNSPMAGKTLNFSGRILTVRDATEKELTEGLHGEYVQSNCGCHGGCGGHGEGHGDGCCHGEGHCHGNGEGHCHHGEDHEGGCCGGHGEGHGDGCRGHKE